ncbi:hypothetical protein VULLAG_LOCUS21812 [Vulpes lagopus]
MKWPSAHRPNHGTAPERYQYSGVMITGMVSLLSGCSRGGQSTTKASCSPLPGVESDCPVKDYIQGSFLLLGHCHCCLPPKHCLTPRAWHH